MVIGGMIATKTIKFTKYNQAMAFITIEDLTGTVEVIIFPEGVRLNRCQAPLFHRPGLPQRHIHQHLDT